MKTAVLRNRIKLISAVRTADQYGGATYPETIYGEMQARIDPLSSRETYFSEALQATVTHRIRIRYRTGVKMANIIRWTTPGFNREFRIDSMVVVDEMKQWIDFITAEQPYRGT